MAKKSTYLKELHNTFQENGISPETITENNVLIRELKKHAEVVADEKDSLRTVDVLREWGRENAVHVGCGQHKKGIGIKREISHEIEHVFIFLDNTRDGAAVHSSL